MFVWVKHKDKLQEAEVRWLHFPNLLKKSSVDTKTKEPGRCRLLSSFIALY